MEAHLGETLSTRVGSAPAVAAGPRHVPGASNGYCIIVDDDAGICKALSFTLQRAGFDTTAAASTAALDEALSERAPDLVFLDLSLGNAGADDMMPVLARHDYSGPVQVMSGKSQDALDEAVAAGEQHGLRMLPGMRKPFRMGVVKDLIASLNRH